MTTSLSLLLREHGTTSANLVPAGDISALLGSGARLTIEGGPGGQAVLRAAEVVGSFVAGTTRVTIAPKVPIQRLMYLLGYLADLPRLMGPVMMAGDVDLLDVMQGIYATALERALAGGLVHSYQEAYRPLVGVRGRIDGLALATRRFGVFPPLDCRFEEYTADIEVNRRLLSACVLLARVSRKGTTVAARLRALAAKMEEVSPALFEVANLTPLTLDRRYDRYGPAVSLAELVLRHCSLELAEGRVRSLGFLVDMNVVYENFVAEGLRRALDLPAAEWVRHPGGLHLAEGPRVPIIPDVVWMSAARTARLVLDVKYKVADEPKRDDLYQMVAYCRALGLDRGVLVYASIGEQHLVVKNGGPTIHVFGLDPDADPLGLEGRLAALASRVRVLAA